jgi:pimeloyl-ACP methyl ester carboxylesterase
MRKHTIVAGGYRLAANRLGKGVPIVIPCMEVMTGLRLEWARFARLLSRQFSVDLVDLAGGGESELLREVPSIDLYVQQIVDVLDALRVESAVLIGASLSNRLLLHALPRLSGRVRGVVLISPVFLLGPDTRSTFAKNITPAQDRRLVRIYQDPNASEAEKYSWARFNRTRVWGPGAAPPKSHIRGMVRLWHGPRRDVTVMISLADYSDALLDTHAASGVPTLVLFGSNDVFVNAKNRAAWRARYPHFRYQTISGGHPLPLVRPRAVSQAISRFVETLDATG